MAKISVKDSVQKGWALSWKHAGVLIGSQALLLAAEFLLPSWVQQIPGVDASIQWTVNIALFIASTFLALGFYRAVERAAHGKTPAWSDLVSEYQAFGNYLLGSIIYAVVGFGPPMIAAFMLYQSYQAGVGLFSPAMAFLFGTVLSGFWLTRFQFFVWFLLRGDGFGRSFKQSWQVTRGHFGAACALLVLTQVIYFAGLLALGIGLAVAYPVTSIASVLLLDKLENGRSG